ncbi:MAG: RNA polymerase-associated protein RapA [Flavobacteriales bacterium]
MEEFVLGQRWSSEGEPELGVGVVKELSKGRVLLEFLAAKESRMYASENAPLRRVSFKAGDIVSDVDNNPFLISEVRELGDLLIYLSETGLLSEADMGEVSVKHTLSDQLFLGHIDSRKSFDIRRNIMQYDFERKLSAVHGFVGARIDLIPHQFYIANEVCSRYSPRVLLADEVGLGKTIEACLIMHKLLLTGRVSRVLILVPDSLVHQWFVEILRKFNMWFNIFDEERCNAIEEGAPEGNPFLADQLVLCSTSFLAGSSKRAQQAVSASWDMLIVDEAHHLKWTEKEVSPEYAIVEVLSEIAHSLLLLSATPEQLGVESHFARLRLLDPERYSNLESFKNEAAGHQPIADLVEQLSSNKPLTKKQEGLLEQLTGETDLDLKDAETRTNLIEDLLDQHGPGRVMFRNTRAALKGFPKRTVELVTLENTSYLEDSELIDRFKNEFSADIGLRKSLSVELSVDPRVDWLVKLLADTEPAKILLICRTKQKVLALEQAIAKKVRINVGVFHESLTLVQRDKNAAWFEESNGARLLICSEIGSEGRNFQFAHHLVLFDLPAHPELLVQRIGRLDRIGQKNTIKILVPFLKNSPQEGLARWYHKGLNAFEENLEAGDQLISEFGKELTSALLEYPEEKAQKAIATLIKKTKAYKDELQEVLAKGKDRLLERNSFRKGVATELLDDVRELDADESLEEFLKGVFEHFRVDMEYLAPHSYYLRTRHENAELFSAIPEGGVSVTFDRKKALSREDLSFLSWDHPIVTGIIDMILSSGKGAVSYGELKTGSSAEVLMEFIFVLETTGGKQLNANRFLPSTLIRVVLDDSAKNITKLNPPEKFEKELLSGDATELIESTSFQDELFPGMLNAAREIANNKASEITSNSVVLMKSQLGYELQRLKSLSAKNPNIRPEELALAKAELDELKKLISKAQVRLDAMRLVKVVS